MTVFSGVPRRLLLLLCLASAFLAAAAGAQDPKGVWITDKGGAKIEISQCGDKLCGEIVWLREPNEDSGEPKKDDENPDPELRDRPLLGLPILSGFPIEPNSKGLYTDGTIYDAEKGKTYKCQMSFKSEDELKIRGYLGISLLGRTTVWTRSSL